MLPGYIVCVCVCVCVCVYMCTILTIRAWQPGIVNTYWQVVQWIAEMSSSMVQVVCICLHTQGAHTHRTYKGTHSPQYTHNTPAHCQTEASNYLTTASVCNHVMVFHNNHRNKKDFINCFSPSLPPHRNSHTHTHTHTNLWHQAGWD